MLMNSLGLLLAVMVNRKLPRSIRPSSDQHISSHRWWGLAYVAIIWQALYQPDTGVVNYYVTSLGGPRIPWSTSNDWAIPSVVIIDVWKNVGFGMLIFLAALQDVPSEVVEAAQVDGANSWTVFRKITVPLISPAIFFNVTLTVIGAFQIFESIMVLTGGGPGDRQPERGYVHLREAFQTFKRRLCVGHRDDAVPIIMVLTLIQFRGPAFLGLL